ncbi:MAG: hypothetical protein JJW01_01695 [Alphaproteobacteria bacterium]|nr:hypothetical protein [Rickettsiales bacterium]
MKNTYKRNKKTRVSSVLFMLFCIFILNGCAKTYVYTPSSKIKIATPTTPLKPKFAMVKKPNNDKEALKICVNNQLQLDGYIIELEASNERWERFFKIVTE